MTTLVVGCPVRQRTWIIKQWFEHVEHACRIASVEPIYAFVADHDDETVQELSTLMLVHSRRAVFAWCTEDLTEPDTRKWDHDRFGRMVELRNQLLHLVRQLAPDYFLSLDSDILLHPQVIQSLLDVEGYDAVGGATFMGSGTHLPSCGWHQGMEGLVRREMEAKGVVRVGVIMAIKLMAPAAYAVDYEFSVQGEDIGWSVACERAGLRLAWDNRFTSKHVMEPAHLGQIDPRCGW